MALYLCDVSAVLPDQPLCLDLPSGRPVAVFSAQGMIFVTDDTCTHGDASLAEGLVDGFEIECPYHLGRFDLRTGAATAAPCIAALRTYPVTIRDGGVYIEDSA